MSDLPNSWVMAPLGEIGKWTSGGTPSRANPSYFGGDIPWLKTGDLNDATVTFIPERITESGMENSSAKWVPRGSLVVAMYGATIGKLGILGLDACTNQACGILRAEGPTVDAIPYIFRGLKAFRRDLIELGKGGAQPNISQDLIKNFEIPFAPLQEQRRIVAKLDALQSRTRLAREALAAIPTLLDHYRQSVLISLLKGNLTENWRVVTASKSKGSDILSALNEVPDKAPDEEESLPEGWCWTRLGKICTVDTGFAFKSSDYQASGIPLIRISNIQNGGIRIKDDPVCMPSPYLKDYSSFVVRDGDILMALSGATTGKTGIYRSSEASLLNQRVGRFRFKSSLFSSGYKSLLIASIQSRVLKEAYGAAQPNISPRQIADFVLPLPSMEEQVELGRIYDFHIRKFDLMANGCKQVSESVSHLDQSLLATAFRGELVPQDPTDEPASVLLDRIRAARAQAGDASRTRRPRSTATPPPSSPAAAPVPPPPATTTGPYETLLAALRTHGSLASADAQAATGLDATAVRPLLQRLVAEGQAKVEGQKRGTRYVAITP